MPITVICHTLVLDHVTGHSLLMGIGMWNTVELLLHLVDNYTHLRHLLKAYLFD